MRKSVFILAVGFFFALCLFSSAFAVPDPRDSVIIESKTIAPGVGSPAAVVGVFITNKDTIACVTLALEERSISGGAYMTLAWPRSFSGVVVSLSTPLGVWNGFSSRKYNSVSPDTFVIGLYYDGLIAEPPNPVRKRIVEIKFDSVWSNNGEIELDSAFVTWDRSKFSTSFVEWDLELGDISVNFVKGVIIVAEPARGDMNGDGVFSVVDVALLSNCVFQEGAYQKRADVTCDGIVSASDVVALLNRVFLEIPLSQCPS